MKTKTNSHIGRVGRYPVEHEALLGALAPEAHLQLASEVRQGDVLGADGEEGAWDER